MNLHSTLCYEASSLYKQKVNFFNFQETSHNCENILKYMKKLGKRLLKSINP